MLVCSGVDEVAIFAAPPQSINEAKICIANCAVSNKYDAFSRRYARTIIPGSLAHLLLTRLVANAAHLASASAVIYFASLHSRISTQCESPVRNGGDTPPFRVCVPSHSTREQR